MTEEIIIDGVNVAGCINFVGCNMCNDFLDGQCEGHNCEYKQLKRLEQERDDLQLRKDKYYQQTLDDAITISDLITKCNDLEQENKELKEKYTHVLELAKTNADSNEYCLQELEKENKELKEMLSKEPKAMQAFQIAYSGLKKENEVLWGMVEDYKSALEEINLVLDELKQQYDYMTDYSEIKEIQDKINECLQ